MYIDIYIYIHIYIYRRLTLTFMLIEYSRLVARAITFCPSTLNPQY